MSLEWQRVQGAQDCEQVGFDMQLGCDEQNKNNFDCVSKMVRDYLKGAMLFAGSHLEG